MKLLVVAADRMEFSGILAHASQSAQPPLAADWARAIRLGDHDMLLVANGVGVSRAAAAAEAGIATFAPNAVASVGFCGALDGGLATGDIVVATEVIGGETRYAAEPVESPWPHRCGSVRTNPRVVQTDRERRTLRATGVLAVEMEASAVAESAQAHGLPFYCIKAVTDLAGETMANDFNRALREDGHFDTIVLLLGSLRNPFARIPELLRLRRRCARAARSMGDFFANCRF